MLLQRFLVAFLLIPVVIGSAWIGSPVFTGIILFAMGVAAWEFSSMFQKGQYKPASIFVIPAVLTLIIRFEDFHFPYEPVFGFIILVSAVYFVTEFEKNKQAVLDYCISLAGAVYIGWLGAYFLNVRSLDGGFWWFLLIIFSIWSTDVSSYFVGKALGKHKIFKLVSPKKTWEGYIGGVVLASLLTMLFGWLFHRFEPNINLINGLILGLAISIFAPFGDFTISMLKRQFELKDTGKTLPGHGGFLDRLDTLLWAFFIGYYLITWFWYG